MAEEKTEKAPPKKDDEAIAAHPYIQNPFPSLWDGEWIVDFKQDEP